MKEETKSGRIVKEIRHRTRKRHLAEEKISIVLEGQHGFAASMSGTGNCYDNAAVETFFKTIKAELL